MLSVKQGNIKYHFLSLWYDSTCDWTPVSRAIGEHSSHLTNFIVNNLFEAVFVSSLFLDTIYIFATLFR